MTPHDYKRAKDAGMLTMARMNEQVVAIGCRGFDPVTGVECEPTVEQFNIAEVKKQLDVAEAGVAMLKEFVADLESTPVIKSLGGRNG